MNDISEYNDNTSNGDLQIHLYEKIQSGELTTFKALKGYIRDLPDSSRIQWIVQRAFLLQQKLYWGLFNNISPDLYPKVWKAIVLIDEKFPFAGDLKRYMSIPEIYLGILDIHGYSRYCQTNKRNLSMIDLLDRMIQEDIHQLCSGIGVVSRRARGDEILLMGASAADVLSCIMQIMDYFRMNSKIRETSNLRKRIPGTIIPEFQISAGLAGGQKFTPLVITRDGDISGDIVNTAARLQVKSNQISPDKNKILITSHVYQKLQEKSGRAADSYLAGVDFLNIGLIEFKGINRVVYDVIFLPNDEHRLLLREPMIELHQSLEQGLWRSKIFKLALRIAGLEINHQRISHYKLQGGNTVRDGKCRNLLEKITTAGQLFDDGHYDAAINAFSEIIDELNLLGSIDSIVLEYLEIVKLNYLNINKLFNQRLDSEIEERLDVLFSMKEKDNFILLRKYHSMFERVMSGARQKYGNHKVIWHRITAGLGDNLIVNLTSRK